MMERTIDAVLQTLRDGGIRDTTLFFGDPMMMAQYRLPMIAVGPNEEYTQAKTTHKDETVFGLYVWCIVSARDRDVDAFDESPSTRELLRLTDGHYSNDGTLLSPGVRSILRSDVQLGGKALLHSMSRTEYRNGILSNEAVRVARISIEVKQFVTRR